MVLLITGASHTGKTLLAQRLLQTYRCPCLSMDLLKMGLIRSGNTRLTPEDDQELESYLWPIVREIIKTAIENRQDLIVEGCYVPPRWSQDFYAVLSPGNPLLLPCDDQGIYRDPLQTYKNMPVRQSGALTIPPVRKRLSSWITRTISRCARPGGIPVF